MFKLLLASLPFMLALLSSPAPAQGISVSSPEGQLIPPAQISASPARITLDLDGPSANGSIRLQNLGDKPVSVRTQVSNFRLDEDNRLEEIPPTPQSLDQWIIINPVEFTIPAGQQQVVRFSVRPRTRPAPGEHRAMVFFEEVPEPAVIQEGVRVNFRMGVAIYGLAGEAIRRGRLHGLEARQAGELVELAADIESLGNALVRLEGQYSIWPREQFPGAAKIRKYKLTEQEWNVPEEAVAVGPTPSTPVFPGTRRTIRFPLENPQLPGDYIVAIHGTLGEETVTDTVTLTVR
jgi:hypothetical protein